MGGGGGVHKHLIYPNICASTLEKITARQPNIAAEALKCCTLDESGPLKGKYCMTIHDQNENTVFSLWAGVVYQTLTNAHRCQLSARLFQLNVKSRCSLLHWQIVVLYSYAWVHLPETPSLIRSVTDEGCSCEQWVKVNLCRNTL